jgi:L-rhamnose mutarotase
MKPSLTVGEKNRVSRAPGSWVDVCPAHICMEGRDNPMQRYASIFRIKPELKEEYRKDHDEIWPDMAEAIRNSGIRNYSIFFRKDGTLFAYFEADNPEAAFEYIAGQEVNERWQKAMDRYFVKVDSALLGPEMEELEEVFHID